VRAARPGWSAVTEEAVTPETRHEELRRRALTPNAGYLKKLREQNKLTARERLDLLLDSDFLCRGRPLREHRERPRPCGSSGAAPPCETPSI